MLDVVEVAASPTSAIPDLYSDVRSVRARACNLQVLGHLFPEPEATKQTLRFHIHSLSNISFTDRPAHKDDRQAICPIHEHSCKRYDDGGVVKLGHY
jgi:hypothetical protein